MNSITQDIKFKQSVVKYSYKHGVTAAALVYKLQLEKGTSNIFVESENGVTAELQLEYMQDNNLIREQEHKALKGNSFVEALMEKVEKFEIID